jgi:hypothetical protein
MLWLRAKTTVVSNKRRVLHLPRAASAKTFILLGVCLKQPSTKQAIKTFTEHCACLNNRFLSKNYKNCAKQKPKNPQIFSILLIAIKCVHVNRNLAGL